MSVKHVVTRGYGNGTFAGVIADVVTRGYIPGEADTDVAGRGGQRRWVLSDGTRFEGTEIDVEIREQELTTERRRLEARQGRRQRARKRKRTEKLELQGPLERTPIPDLTALPPTQDQDPQELDDEMRRRLLLLAVAQDQ